MERAVPSPSRRDTPKGVGALAGNTVRALRPLVNLAPAGSAVEIWGNLQLRTG